MAWKHWPSEPEIVNMKRHLLVNKRDVTIMQSTRRKSAVNDRSRLSRALPSRSPGFDTQPTSKYAGINRRSRRIMVLSIINRWLSYVTSNCQCAACRSCFAWSAAQPAVKTNWLIITWCLSSSIFTDIAAVRSSATPVNGKLRTMRACSLKASVAAKALLPSRSLLARLPVITNISCHHHQQQTRTRSLIGYGVKTASTHGRSIGPSTNGQSAQVT